jgi:N-methylhydantoinase B/oxoprolinase/acetone carboxylase alpha subunit
METIEQMIDRVSEYESKRDSIEAEKRALLDEVKVPAEVLEVQKAANVKMTEIDNATRAAIETVRSECRRQLSAIVIPDEVKALLAEIDRQREAVEIYQRQRESQLQEASTARRQEAFEKSQTQTAQVYANIARRKQEIEIEFAGKSGVVDENIAALKAEIQTKVLSEGKTYQGAYLMAVYAKGRVGSWNSGKLDGLAEIMPEILKCRNPGGEPTVTFRRK